MKRINLRVVVCGFCFGLSASVVWLRPVHADWVLNEAMKRKASFEVKDASVEDYILQASRAYKVNLILDSTRVPQDAPPINQKIEDYSMWGGLQFFAPRNQLNARQLGDGNTILLWQQPDMAQLARQLLATGEVKTVPDDTLNRVLLSSNLRQIQPLLSAFLEEKKAWDGQRPFHATATFEELPDELKSRLALHTRARVWNVGKADGSARWFSDDFWKSARIHFMAGRGARGNNRSELAVTGVLQRNPDGSAAQGSVFLLAPTAPIIRLKAARPAPKAATLPNPDTVLVNSPLARPYQPLPDTNLDLASEAALSSKITLELKRRPVGEVVATLSEKARVPLSLSPELEAKPTLLTFGITQMPLHEAMAALRQLLGWKWSKAPGGGYIAGRGDGTLLDTELLQAQKLSPAALTGENAALQARQEQENQERTARITLAVGQTALARAGGVAFFDLPDELQKELRSHVEAGIAPNFVDSQGRLRENLSALSGAWRLDFDVPAEKSRRVVLKGGRVVEVPFPSLVKVQSLSGQTLASIDLPDNPPQNRVPN